MDEDTREGLLLLIDRLDNYAAALTLKIAPDIHVAALREGLPDVASRLRKIVEAT